MNVLGSLESEYGLPRGILDALWAQESSRGKNMLNKSSGAAGHFQIMPENYQRAGIDPYDIEQSGRWTAEYAKNAMDAFPGMNPTEAIAKHHFGGPNTKIWGPKTRQYAADIAARLGGNQMQYDPGNYHAATAAPGVAAQGQGPLVGVDPQTQGPLLAGGMPDGSLFGNPLLQAGMAMAGAALTPGGPNPLAAGMAGYMAPQNAQRQFAQEIALKRATPMTPAERERNELLRMQIEQQGQMSPYQQASAEIAERKQQILEQQTQQEAAARAAAIKRLAPTAGGEDAAAFLVDNAPKMASKMMQYGTAEPVTSKDVDDLRKEYNSLDPVKKYREASSVYSALRKSLEQTDNPVTAVSSVIQLIKTLDPSSTVTEGEMGLIQGASGPFAQLISRWNKAAGDGALTDALRMNIDRAARAGVEGRMAEVGKLRQQYEGIGRQRGITQMEHIVGAPMSIPDPLVLTRASTSAVTPPIPPPPGFDQPFMGAP